MPQEGPKPFLRLSLPTLPSYLSCHQKLSLKDLEEEGSDVMECYLDAYRNINELRSIGITLFGEKKGFGPIRNYYYAGGRLQIP